MEETYIKIGITDYRKQHTVFGMRLISIMLAVIGMIIGFFFLMTV